MANAKKICPAVRIATVPAKIAVKNRKNNLLYQIKEDVRQTSSFFATKTQDVINPVFFNSFLCLRRCIK